MERIDLPHSTFCVVRVNGSFNWYDAAAHCSTSYGARLCSAIDFWRAACLYQRIPSSPTVWLGDYVSNAVRTAGASCAHAEDVRSFTISTQLGAACCLEWPRY